LPESLPSGALVYGRRVSTLLSEIADDPAATGDSKF
jgi:hypothetical protein